MTRNELENAISNIEFSLEDKYTSSFNLRKKALESVLDNYKELLLYKKQSIGCSPVKVGDRLYAFPIDEYLGEYDCVEIYDIERIVITKDDTLLCYDPYDGVICNLNSLLEGKEYCGKRIFINRETAEKEIAKAKKRMNLN